MLRSVHFIFTYFDIYLAGAIIIHFGVLKNM